MRSRHSAPLSLFAALALVGCAADPVTPLANDRPSLITYGKVTPDHPEVVLLIAEIGGRPAWRCSGALIAPRKVLTAGHCTGEAGELSGMRIFTEANVQTGNNNYPFAGPNSVEATRWASHPDFRNASFSQNDVGMITLGSDVTLPDSAYGELPAVNALDAMKPGQRSSFTAVGYGLQRINPVFVEGQRVRMLATPFLLKIGNGIVGSRSLLLSNNASSGGTCFGDSGGPNFIGSSNLVAGVTSFAINGNCAGTGGVFRLDRADVLAFITAEMLKP